MLLQTKLKPKQALNQKRHLVQRLHQSFHFTGQAGGAQKKISASTGRSAIRANEKVCARAHTPRREHVRV